MLLVFIHTHTHIYTACDMHACVHCIFPLPELFRSLHSLHSLRQQRYYVTHLNEMFAAGARAPLHTRDNLRKVFTFKLNRIVCKHGAQPSQAGRALCDLQSFIAQPNPITISIKLRERTRAHTHTYANTV